MDNVILIGLPTCGKSTVGVLLAKMLGYRFLDSDLLIQEQKGKLLHELIAEWGAEGFIEIENEVNKSIQATRTVIATGGSAVYGKEAMEHLKCMGTVVYLRIDYATLRARLGDYVHRGVVMPKGYTLQMMFEERTALYERYADVTVDTGAGMELGEVLEQICKALGQ